MKPIRQLEIHLTHRCTLRCSYCYASCQNGQLPPDLTEDLADRAVDFLFTSSGEAPDLKIGLWGGEPMMRPDLIERIAKRAHQAADKLGKSVRISMPSNGTLIDKQKIDLFLQHNITFSLSLDGGPEAHAERRDPSGRNSWERIESGLKVLDTYPRLWRPSVRMTVTPHRASHFQQDLTYLLDQGFRRIAFMPASGMTWSAAQTDAFDEQLKRAGDDLIDWIRRGIKDLPWYSPVLRRLAALWVQKQTGVLPKRNFTCGAGSSLVAVNTLGDIYPCHRFMASKAPPKEMQLGTLERGITNHDLYQKLADFGPDSPGCRCESCDHRLQCGRFCIFVNHAQTGQFTQVADEVCFANDRLRSLAQYIHNALADNPHYKDYIEPFVDADPDERFLPLFAAMETKEDEMLERIGQLMDVEE